jgi:DNA-binding MarR family transcriptional regulator
MYGSHMSSPTSSWTRLDDLDAALIDVRRFWQRPGLQRRFFADLGEPVELSVLRTLRAIEAGGGGEMCVGDVASALAVDASTASRLVDQAVGAGYVVRTASERDRRRTALELSPAGIDLLDRATAVRREILREMTAGWADEEVETLAGLLRRLRSELDRLGL